MSNPSLASIDVIQSSVDRNTFEEQVFYRIDIIETSTATILEMPATDKTNVGSFEPAPKPVMSAV
jgi:hypothetical protein